MGIVELVSKSLFFDIRLASIRDIPLRQRVRLLFDKYLALGLLALRRPTYMRVGQVKLRLRSLSELGTLQSCIVDVFDELIATGLLGPSPRVIDVGANIGQWSTALLLFHPDAQILAIEPNPMAATQLKDNLSNAPSVSIVEAAAGSSSRQGELFVQPLHGMSTLYPSYGDDFNNLVTVNIQAVDDMADEAFGTAVIDLLKIDVEGAELDVINGSRRALERTRYLVVEVSLARGPVNALELLRRLSAFAPNARILKFGRHLGPRNTPSCQDVVISVR